MIKQLLLLIIRKLDEREQKCSGMNNKIVEMVEEINELEEEYVEALADAERWGDLTDKSNWRTVEVNRLERLIQARKRMLESLQNQN